jgi:hypothetical protein
MCYKKKISWQAFTVSYVLLILAYIISYLQQAIHPSKHATSNMHETVTNTDGCNC